MLPRSSGCVSVFDCDGTFVEKVGETLGMAPRGIACSATDGELYVVDRDAHG